MTDDEVKQELFRLQGVDIQIGDCFMAKETRHVFTVDFVSTEHVGFRHSFSAIQTNCTVRRAIVPDYFEKLTVESCFTD